MGISCNNPYLYAAAAYKENDLRDGIRVHSFLKQGKRRVSPEERTEDLA